MKGLNWIFILAISILSTSCSTLISTNQVDSNYSPIERSFYTQSSLINKKLFAETKSEETKVVKAKKEKTAIEEINDIHSLAINSFAFQILTEAESYLGTPYRYGGTTRRGIDCSSFVQQVFEIFNYELPRISSAQAQQGHTVSTDEVRPGDLLFFATGGGGRVSHVGIVHNVSDDGEIEFIHASTSQGVTVTPLSSSYWSKRYLYAKRILD